MWYLGEEDEANRAAPEELLDYQASTPRQPLAPHEVVEVRVPEVPAPFPPKGFEHRLGPKLLAGNESGVALFGSVPPRASVLKDPAKITAMAKGFTEQVCKLPGLDGVIVYDIQDEEGRDKSIERPYKFAATMSPAAWARELLAAGGVETIVYHGVAGEDEAALGRWLEEVRATSRCVVLVGGSSSREAARQTVEGAAAAVRGRPGFAAGGIWLPERHRDKGDEHARLARKAAAGLAFFTSQVIFNADVAIWALRDYDEHCKASGERPGRLVFTFAPFGRPDTAVFLKWLGVEIPLGTEKRILSRKTRPEALRECVELCRENFKRILYAVEFYDVLVPIGISVESVSKYRDEYAASLQLFTVLEEEMRTFFKRMRLNSLKQKWWGAEQQPK